MTGGIFGGIFDFDHDGRMNVFESGAEFAFLNHMMSEEDREEKIEELIAAGIDPEDFEMMDETDRIEALEDAGLDPDDYDFD